MIWLFEFDDKFFGDKSQVDRHYLFNEDDINFDMSSYNIMLYMGTNNYFLMNDTNPDEIYYLQYSGTNSNPSMSLIEINSYYYNIIRKYHIEKIKK